MDSDRLVKQKFNVFLVIDISSSMRGERIKQVNNAILDISKYLRELQNNNTNIDFYVSILTFGTEASWYKDKKEYSINDFEYDTIFAKGQSNLHLAYHELNLALKKTSKGGMMPDFGGVAPIILLLTDGHPSKGNFNEELILLKKKPWFNVALRYGIAIESNDNRTVNVLRNFVDKNGDVIEVYDSNLLQKIIKIIVMTASKVKSLSNSTSSKKFVNIEEQIQQEIQENLTDIDNLEW